VRQIPGISKRKSAEIKNVYHIYFDGEKIKFDLILFKNA
jgi:hypothetical protein